MAVSILEALMNAKHNLENPVMPFQKKMGLEQLGNAIALLEKGYPIDEEVEPLLEKYGSAQEVPEKPKYQKLRDDDSHWYWIPDDMVDDFNKRIKALAGLQYSDDPDAFDEFESKYDQYRTGGDPNNVPAAFQPQA